MLICNGRFESVWHEIYGVAKDAERLSQALADTARCGFAVECLLDKGLLEVRVAIARACAASGEDDTLFLYYGGVGIVDNEGCLQLPVWDSVEDQLQATSVEAEFVLSQMRASKCRRFVLVVDGCHSGAFFRRNRGIPDGMVAITSCREDEYARDTIEGGTFTTALLHALSDPAADKNHDGVVTVDEAFDYVQAYLAKEAPEMHPQKWVWNLEDPIPLVRSTLRVFLSYSTKDEPIADRLVCELAQRGIAVWRDVTGVAGGSDWVESILAGLSSSRAVLFLLTQHSADSEWVRRELTFATSKRKIPILPISAGPVDPPDWFALQFDNIQRQQFDLEQPATLDAIAQSVRRVIASSG